MSPFLLLFGQRIAKQFDCCEKNNRTVRVFVLDLLRTDASVPIARRYKIRRKNVMLSDFRVRFFVPPTPK